MKNLLYILPIAIALSACRSGAIMEPEKKAPPANASQKQVYWADADYNTNRQPAQPSKLNPNIVIERQPNVQNYQAPVAAPTTSMKSERYVPASLREEAQVVAQPQQAVAPAPTQMQEEDAQRLYSILTPRTVNKMLKETEKLQKNGQANLFIAFPTVDNQNFAMPAPEYAEILTEDIIVGSKSFNVVNSAEQADYILKTHIRGATATSRGTPVVVYKLTLTDKQNAKVGTWTESASQVANDDRSWW